MSKHYLHLHFIVLILGFTAILGKLIHTDAVSLVWYRTMIALVASFLVAYFTVKKIRLPLKDAMLLLATGLIVGLHWIFFFHSIKVSNVSLCLATLPVSTLFTAIAEPLSQKRKISLLDVIVGIIILIGLNTIFQFETRYTQGIIFGVLSFILAGIFSVINKNISQRFNSLLVNAYEMTGAFAGISIFWLLTSQSFPVLTSNADLFYLIILGTVCTTYAFSATVEIMKKLSAYSVVLAINLEPVYGILLAFLFFGNSELMSTGFYVGAVITFVAVLIYPYLKKRFN